ncbi:MAG: hypothetical protein CL910_16300 [Deltaproteobacteria bacterium]|jgi:hypothetical protein|nr:hypothetical protein [Deltaproteobacteria bacterium]
MRIKLCRIATALTVLLSSTGALALSAPPGRPMTPGIPEPASAAMFAAGAAIVFVALRKQRR